VKRSLEGKRETMVKRGGSASWQKASFAREPQNTPQMGAEKKNGFRSKKKKAT